MTVMRSALFILAAATLLGGCATYEYDLTAPSEFARHIPRKVDAVVTREPFEYKMQSVDNRLVIRIYNQTDDQIQLLGERSSIVDPDGQSHPLRGGPIAPHSFLKLIIPPPRPRVYESNPTFGVGVGVGVGSYHNTHHHHPYYHSNDPLDDYPRYIAVYDDNDTRYWDWKGEGEARLNLVFQHGDKEIRQEFTFRRGKV